MPDERLPSPAPWRPKFIGQLWRFCLAPIENLWERNQANSHIQLSKFEKLRLGLYLIIRDWRAGIFPPKFERESTWENERRFVGNVSGLTLERAIYLSNEKPFAFTTNEFEEHAANFSRIRRMLRAVGVRPPASVLELGCGQGWLSEMLAITGFTVTGTSIAPFEVMEAQRRAQAFKLRSLSGSLLFAVVPMESVGDQFRNQDCVLVYEALHHAFDWQETVHSAAKALKPGGWFFICAEPNIAHTMISYRVGKLTSTHEVGISRRKLKRELRAAGFDTIKVFSSPFHFWVRWHWIAARLPASRTEGQL